MCEGGEGKFRRKNQQHHKQANIKPVSSRDNHKPSELNNTSTSTSSNNNNNTRQNLNIQLPLKSQQQQQTAVAVSSEIMKEQQQNQGRKSNASGKDQHSNGVQGLKMTASGSGESHVTSVPNHSALSSTSKESKPNNNNNSTKKKQDKISSSSSTSSSVSMVSGKADFEDDPRNAFPRSISSGNEDDDNGNSTTGRFTKEEQEMLVDIIKSDDELTRSFLHKVRARQFQRKSWMHEIAVRFKERSGTDRSLDAVRHHFMLRRVEKGQHLNVLLSHAVRCSRKASCTKCLLLARERVELGLARCGSPSCTICRPDLPSVFDPFSAHEVMQQAAMGGAGGVARLSSLASSSGTQTQSHLAPNFAAAMHAGSIGSNSMKQEFPHQGLHGALPPQIHGLMPHHLQAAAQAAAAAQQHQTSSQTQSQQHQVHTPATTSVGNPALNFGPLLGNSRSMLASGQGSAGLFSLGGLGAGNQVMGNSNSNGKNGHGMGLDSKEIPGHHKEIQNALPQGFNMMDLSQLQLAALANLHQQQQEKQRMHEHEIRQAELSRIQAFYAAMQQQQQQQQQQGGSGGPSGSLSNLGSDPQLPLGKRSGSDSSQQQQQQQLQQQLLQQLQRQQPPTAFHETIMAQIAAQQQASLIQSMQQQQQQQPQQQLPHRGFKTMDDYRKSLSPDLPFFMQQQLHMQAQQLNQQGDQPSQQQQQQLSSLLSLLNSSNQASLLQQLQQQQLQQQQIAADDRKRSRNDFDGDEIDKRQRK